MMTKTYRYSELADALIASGSVADMATDFQGWKTLALMLADLGEEARDIFDRISATASNYDSKQTQSIFSWALNHYDPTKITIGSFLHLCTEAGINTFDYVTTSPAALRPVSREHGEGVKSARRKPYEPNPLPADSTLYSLPGVWITAPMSSSYEKSALARCLARKFGWDKVNEAFKMYYVGLTRKPICLHEGCSLPAGSCIFPQIDERGCVRTAQMIAFDDEGGRFGHRSKRGSGESLLTWMHTVMMAELMKMTANQWGWDDNRRRKPYNCITGAHLLNEKAYPALVGKTVGIVESVSTALCMTCAMPDIVWLATAGASGIRLVADAIKRDAPSLASRNIIVYPDEGKTDQWRKAISALGLPHVSVSDFMDRQPIHGGDIKDIVMSSPYTFDTLPEKPEAPLVRSGAEQFMEGNDGLKTLVETFDLFLINK